jgi:hypothetical protein
MFEFAKTIEETSGKPVAIKPFPWWFMNLLRPFMVVIQGAFEMRYLWQHELLLDDSKLQKVLDGVPHAPLGKALVECGYIKVK